MARFLYRLKKERLRTKWATDS